MKKLLLFAAAFLLALPFTWAQTGGGDDPFEILIGEGGTGNGGPEHRSPGTIPFQVAYSSSLSSLLLTFNDNLGSVAIRVENLTTGWYLQTQVNAVSGSQLLPISGTSGYYEITFTLTDGHIYIGYFEIE